MVNQALVKDKQVNFFLLPLRPMANPFHYNFFTDGNRSIHTKR